jgi:hypothetical protein
VKPVPVLFDEVVDQPEDEPLLVRVSLPMCSTVVQFDCQTRVAWPEPAPPPFCVTVVVPSGL